MFFGVVVFLNGCFSNRVGEKSHPYVHCLCNNSSDFANTFENKPRLWSYQSLIMCYKSFCLCLVYYTRKNVLALTHILWKFYSHILFFVTFFFFCESVNLNQTSVLGQGANDSKIFKPMDGQAAVPQSVCLAGAVTLQSCMFKRALNLK